MKLEILEIKYIHTCSVLELTMLNSHLIVLKHEKNSAPDTISAVDSVSWQMPKKRIHDIYGVHM